MSLRHSIVAANQLAASASTGSPAPPARVTSPATRPLALTERWRGGSASIPAAHLPMSACSRRAPAISRCGKFPTPTNPSRAVADGIGEALAQVTAQASDVSYFGHGTTVATNALIQHSGAATGLITSD